ncbi:UNVERIFIED_CONTAM: hypothetical protein LK11_14050 [Mumia flava]
MLHYTVVGSGPRLVWVDPALGSSAMRPLQDAIDALAGRFEVVTYDRRGRGRNAATSDLTVRHEIADLRALLALVGGACAVLGFSSGAALVLQAAAAGPLEAHHAVLLEPAVDSAADDSGLRTRIADALAAGEDEAAVVAFYEATGVPDEILDDLRASRAWPGVVRAAPTLLGDIDLAVVDEDTLGAVAVPTHVVVSTASPPEIVGMAEQLAGRIDARVWREPGHWHGVDPKALTARLEALLDS